MKRFKIPYWVWILAAIAIFSTFGTCGLLDKLIGISGCVQNISSGSIDDTKRLLISQDGQILVVRSGQTNTVDIVSALDGSLINTMNFNSTNNMGAISISPDGTLLAIQKICDRLQTINTSNDQIVFEQPTKYEDCDSFKAGKRLSGGIVFLPDGKHVAYIITTKVVDITKSVIDLIVTNISTSEDMSRLTDHITDRSMEEIVLSQNGKWIALRYKDRYELRTLTDFSLVETATRNDEDAKWYEISPDGKLIKSRVFSSIYSQDGSLKATSAFCDTEISSTITGEIILTLSQPRISLGDHLERISNFFGEPYCSGESIVFTTDNKFVYYSYRNHILKWRLPEIR